MFVRDHLALVAHWARGQLRNGVDTPSLGAQLRQLVEIAESVREGLAGEPEPLADNVIPLDPFRRRAG